MRHIGFHSLTLETSLGNRTGMRWFALRIRLVNKSRLMQDAFFITPPFLFFFFNVLVSVVFLKAFCICILCT